MSKYILSAKQVGERIRKLRIDRDALTICMLAQRSKMTETNWKERERGKMDMRLSTLFRMLAALKVTPQEFFEGLGR